jgi:cytidylate kinase
MINSRFILKGVIMNKVIAIDGPAGSGKGTLAKLLAERLNLVNIDTGAMYRCVALATIDNNVDITDTKKIIEIVNDIKIELTLDGKVFLNDKDVTKDIRSKEVTAIVSPISSIKEVREKMVYLQREIAKGKDVVMEGRDITTVVFPDTKYKFYLDASVEERAKRRYKENLEKGIDMSYQEVYDSIEKRDYNDMHKEVGALMRTDDQIYIDTTNLTVEEEVEIVRKIMEGDKNE